VGFATLFVGGTAAGLLSLAYYEKWLSVRGAPRPYPPGSMAVTEARARRLGIAEWSPAKRMALLIAVGIGLHNFAEGLAIGGSAARGEIALATLLVIGFALHNATEGFGIVAPLAGETERPTWAFLIAMDVIGGGPTFLGTIVGTAFTSDVMSVLFLTLAAGSILYVVIQLLGVAHASRRQDLLYWGGLLGLAAGFLTDLVVAAGGA
jgi:ZIP family zinc transporter